MAAVIMCKITHSTWSTSLLKELSVLREANIMCDVKILLSGSVQTSAHSVVLSAASPFFKSLLSQIEHPEIDMASFPSEVILQILGFVYTGEALFSYTDLVLARKVAIMLQMTVLANLLQNMLMLDKTGAEESTIESTLDSVPGTPVTMINPLQDQQQTESTAETSALVEANEYEEQLPHGLGQDDNEMLQGSFDNLNDMHTIIKDAHLSEGASTYPNSPNKYIEAANVQLRKVLDDLQEIKEHIKDEAEQSDQGDSIVEHKPRRKYPQREKPVQVQNKDIDNDVNDPERALHTLPDSLYTDNSQMNPGELGVFTMEALPRSSTLGPYEGEIVTELEATSLIEPRYCWSIFKDLQLLHWLNGADVSKSNWMRFVQPANVTNANLKAFQKEGQLYFECVRRISPSEELFVLDTYIGYGKVINVDAPRSILRKLLVDSDTVMDSKSTEKTDASATEVTGRTSDGKDESVQNESENSATVEVEFTCETCDTTYLDADVYHRHMRAKHGMPLPLELYVKSMEAQQAENSTTYTINQDESSMANADEDSSVVENSDETAAIDMESSVTDAIEQTEPLVINEGNEMKEESTEPVETKDQKPVTRRSTRTRRQSKLLMDFKTESNVIVVAPIPTPKADELDSSITNIDAKIIVIKPEPGQKEKQKCKYFCDICGKGYKLEQSLRRHEAMTHSKSEKQQVKCDQCGRVFSHIGNLQSHLRAHSGEKPFKCKECGRGFTQKGNMELHMKRHKGQSVNVCELCGKSYNDSSYMKKHMRLVHGDGGELPCPSCNKILSDPSSLRRHMKTHTNQRNHYKCTICGKTFKQQGNLASHKRAHAEGKVWKCSTCDMEFSTRKEIISHVARSHTDEKTYNCSLCGKTFGYPASWAKHQKIGCKARFLHFYAQISDESFTCKMCGTSFEEKESLEQHIAEHFFTCTICSKNFINEANLEDHKKKHLNIKPLVCPICKKGYVNKKEFDSHVRVHDAKTHICTVCGNGCMTASILRNHMLIHTGEKPFECEVCHMHFRMKHQLKRHMETHDEDFKRTGIKDGKARPMCPTCGKTFNDKQALTKHEFLHTGAKPYACRYCGKTFAMKGSLKTHLSSHLGERRFKCTICNKAYRANAGYLAHMETHQERSVEQYQCQYCMKTFASKSSMRGHMSVHLQEKESVDVGGEVTTVLTPVSYSVVEGEGHELYE